MKTLDEVIFNAPYSPTDWAKDALHYLKEYRDRKETLRSWTEKSISEQQNLSDAITFMRAYRDDKDDLTALRAYWKEQHENNALTWDELKQMEGKPVWVEDRAFIDGEEYFDSKWAIVCQVKDKFAMLSIAEGDTCFQKCNYVYDIPGTDHWQAYRKERS